MVAWVGFTPSTPAVSDTIVTAKRVWKRGLRISLTLDPVRSLAFKPVIQRMVILLPRPLWEAWCESPQKRPTVPWQRAWAGIDLDRLAQAPAAPHDVIVTGDEGRAHVTNILEPMSAALMANGMTRVQAATQLTEVNRAKV